MTKTETSLPQAILMDIFNVALELRLTSAEAAQDAIDALTAHGFRIVRELPLPDQE